MSQLGKSGPPAINSTAGGVPGSPSGNLVYAKTIVLGDHESGRSELVRNLDLHSPSSSGNRGHRKFNIVIDESNFFTTIELTSGELDSNVTTYLKVWEHTQHLSKKDEELAFRGALFCIVTFDIRSQQSYRQVFEKWIPLKEQLAPDSFLYIVGTFLDQYSYRQVELEDVCKACARKDAIYVEVSNTTAANVQLLRRLLCRRVHYMLEQKEFFSSPAFQAKLKSINLSTEDEAALRGLVTQQRSPRPETGSEISIPLLEPHILTHSVGAILSSGFDLEEWQGFEQQEQDIMSVAEKIDAFVEQLSQMADFKLSDLDNVSLGDSFGQADSKFAGKMMQMNVSDDQPTADSVPSGEDVSESESFQQLKDAFQILGLNMPESLLEQHQPEPEPAPFNTDTDPFAVPNSTRSNLRKMHVKLPGGHTAEMVLDLEANIEQQIELFLLGNGLNFDLEARNKLLQITQRVQRDYYDSQRVTYGGHRSAPSSRPSTATNTVVSSVSSPQTGHR